MIFFCFLTFDTSFHHNFVRCVPAHTFYTNGRCCVAIVFVIIFLFLFIVLCLCWAFCVVLTVVVVAYQQFYNSCCGVCFKQIVAFIVLVT